MFVTQAVGSQILCSLLSYMHFLLLVTEVLSIAHNAFSEEEFRKVDEHYSSLGDDFKKSRGMAFEERILAYQRQLEERSRTDSQLEVSDTLLFISIDCVCW